MGPAGSTESRTMTACVPGATSTHSPLPMLRRDLRQTASGTTTSLDGILRYLVSRRLPERPQARAELST